MMLLVGEYKVWALIEQWVPARNPVKRVFAFLYFQPRAFVFAFLGGAIAAVACDLAFRLVVRRLMVRWYNPRSFDPSSEPPVAFHLDRGEAVALASPGRVVDGPRRRPPGTFLVTDRRVWFAPYSWELEPWDRPLDDLAEARLEHPPRRVLGLVRGYPENLVLVDRSGLARSFVLPDPIAAFDRIVELAGAGASAATAEGGTGEARPGPLPGPSLRLSSPAGVDG